MVGVAIWDTFVFSWKGVFELGVARDGTVGAFVPRHRIDKLD